MSKTKQIRNGYPVADFIIARMAARKKCVICGQAIFNEVAAREERPVHPSCAPQLLVNEWNEQVKAERAAKHKAMIAARKKYGTTPAGKKRCHQCGELHGVRTKTCNKCGYEFYSPTSS